MANPTGQLSIWLPHDHGGSAPRAAEQDLKMYQMALSDTPNSRAVLGLTDWLPESGQ